MVSTRNRRQEHHPPWATWLLLIGLSPEPLQRTFRELKRELPRLDPARVMDILAPLYPRRIMRHGRVAIAQFRLGEDGISRWEGLDEGHLARVRQRQRAVKAEALAPEQKQYDRAILSVMNWIRSLEILGGRDAKTLRVLDRLRRRCNPAVDQDLLADLDVLRARAAQPREDRILAALEEARLPGRRRPRVPARGPQSALGWLPTVALPLCDYLATVTVAAPDSLAVCRPAARILGAATGRRITVAMVKGRVWRARGMVKGAATFRRTFRPSSLRAFLDGRRANPPLFPADEQVRCAGGCQWRIKHDAQTPRCSRPGPLTTCRAATSGRPRMWRGS